jgi:hypothetical protein
MPKIVSLSIGDRFGKWSLVSPAAMHLAKSGKTEKQWLCSCDCGSERVIRQSSLRRGNTTNCGCYRQDNDKALAAELIGKKFGRLTIVGEASRYVTPKTGKPRRQWRCECDCGSETVTSFKKLQSGHTKSCGCWIVERRYKHGHHQVGRRTKTYQVWDAMVQRCTNEKNEKHYMYGGRGITVCERWLKFENFLADMGERPSPGHSIDRKNNGGHYEPGNCRWATRKEQQRNMRSNHLVEYSGRLMSVAEAAEIAGVKGNKLYPLLNHRGMTIEQAIKHVGG